MTPPETVVLVDEDNFVIGAAPRAQMRAERLLHRACYIFVRDPQGRLYVQQRTTTKDIYPGLYDAATGGVVLAGETYEQSAARELAEELGITGVPLEARFDFYHEDAHSRVWGRVFTCTYEGPVVPQPEEVAAVIRMSVEEVFALPEGSVTPDSLTALRRLLSAGAG